jgi:hypothetical protein
MWKREGSVFEGFGAGQERRLILQQRALPEISTLSAPGLKQAAE